MTAAARYLRLLAAFGRYGLTRELAFRANFLVKISVELLWLGLLLIFYRTVFAKTSVIADWGEEEYLFFVGCYFALEGLRERREGGGRALRCSAGRGTGAGGPALGSAA